MKHQNQDLIATNYYLNLKFLLLASSPTSSRNLIFYILLFVIGGYRSSNEKILSEVDLINSKERVNHEEFNINMEAKDVMIENELFEANFDSSNGMLKTVTNKWNNKINQVTSASNSILTSRLIFFFQINLQFVFYSSRRSKDKSGAYLFLPNGKAELLTTPETRPLIRVTRGPLASQVHVILPNIQHT